MTPEGATLKHRYVPEAEPFAARQGDGEEHS